MDPLNNFFASSGQYAWTASSSFENTQYHDDSGFTAPHAASQPAMPAFTSSDPLGDPGRAPTAGPSHANEPKASQSRNRGLKWDLHQAELQKLYLADNKTLEEIRQWMSRERSFTATYVTTPA